MIKENKILKATLLLVLSTMGFTASLIGIVDSKFHLLPFFVICFVGVISGIYHIRYLAKKIKWQRNIKCNGEKNGKWT